MVSVKEIDAVLPQTQCRECGYSGCLPYAEALAQGSAPINLCPPGGVTTLKSLAALLGSDPEPFVEHSLENMRPPAKAVIREEECIGCTKCLQACPVDAIVGASKLMHVVLDHECTGCGLCIAPCPVDCIEMEVLTHSDYDRDLARARFHNKQTRFLREQHEQQQHYRQKRKLLKTTDALQDTQAKQAYIQEALARVQAKKNSET